MTIGESLCPRMSLHAGAFAMAQKAAWQVFRIGGKYMEKEEKRMAKVELKQPVVEEISNLLKDAKSAVLVDYRGLTVEQDTELRRQLRAAGVNYKVYKNTMINFAIKGTDFEPLKADLEGPTALATSATDETAPARVLNEFSKKADKLELKSGVVEG